MAVALQVRQGTDDWLLARREGIGSSDAPIIAGERGSLVELWGDKTGLAPRPAPDDALVERFRWGHRMEPLVAEAYTERTGRPLRRVMRLLQHPDVPWALASLDRVSARKGERRIVELKVSAIDAKYAGDEVPGDVLAQVQHQMYVTGYEVADVAVLTSYWRLDVFEVPRDDAYIADLLYLERHFWEENVQTRTLPSLDGSETTRRVLARLYERNNGTMLPSSPDLDLLAGELRAAKAEAKYAANHEATIENALRTIIGDADGFEGPWGRVTWKKNADSTKTDWLAIADELLPIGPERVAAIARHTRVVEGPRVLRAHFKEDR